MSNSELGEIPPPEEIARSKIAEIGWANLSKPFAVATSREETGDSFSLSTRLRG